MEFAEYVHILQNRIEAIISLKLEDITKSDYNFVGRATSSVSRKIHLVEIVKM